MNFVKDVAIFLTPSLVSALMSKMTTVQGCTKRWALGCMRESRLFSPSGLWPMGLSSRNLGQEFYPRAVKSIPKSVLMSAYVFGHGTFSNAFYKGDFIGIANNCNNTGVTRPLDIPQMCPPTNARVRDGTDASSIAWAPFLST